MSPVELVVIYFVGLFIAFIIHNMFEYPFAEDAIIAGIACIVWPLGVVFLPLFFIFNGMFETAKIVANTIKKRFNKK